MKTRFLVRLRVKRDGIAYVQMKFSHHLIFSTSPVHTQKLVDLAKKWNLEKLDGSNELTRKRLQIQIHESL